MIHRYHTCKKKKEKIVGDTCKKKKKKIVGDSLSSHHGQHPQPKEFTEIVQTSLQKDT
jgi:hypothetical protein